MADIVDYAYNFNSQVKLSRNYGLMFTDSDSKMTALAANFNQSDGKTVTPANSFLPNFVKFCCSKRLVNYDKNSLPNGSMKDIRYGKVTLYNSDQPIYRKTYVIPLQSGVGADAATKDAEFAARLGVLGGMMAAAGLYYEVPAVSGDPPTQGAGIALNRLLVPGAGIDRDVTQQDSTSTSKTP